MLSQKLSDYISNGQLDSKLQAAPTRTASACSCSACESVCCFYIRNKKSTLPCSCNHPKFYEKCASTREDKEIKVKDNLNQIFDCKQSDIEIESNIKYNMNDKPKGEEIRETLKAQKQDNPKAELSAQIMNVPYEEFKHSLSQKNNKGDSVDNSSTPVFNVSELVKPDLLTRLKEVYKACSCKICECITEKSLPKDVKSKDLCNCTPCDCNECVVTGKITKLDPRPHSGCPCVKCDRKDCRGVVKKSVEVSACDCNVCDCLNCTDMSRKSCTCEPCQCAECLINNRLQKPIVPLNSQKSLTQSTCHCKPCECPNCRQVFTTMAVHDVSKKFSCSYKNNTYLNDLIEFNNNFCECEESEVRGNDGRIASNDNDIHTTFLNDQLVQRTYKNVNTIAMMAMYSTNYSKVQLNGTKDCKCLGCECFVCTSRENDIKNRISKLCFNSIHRNNTALNSQSKPCDCVACQCEVCSYVQNKIAHNLKLLEDNCSCSICDCIMCNRISYNKNKNDDGGIRSSWARQVQGLPLQVTRDTSCSNVYPLKKGKMLVPSMFESNIYEPSCLNSQLYLSDKDFGQYMETIAHSNSKESSNKILPVKQKLKNPKQSNVECENSKRYERNMEGPVKDIFSDNYLKNNNLLIGNTVSNDFSVPTSLNMETSKQDTDLSSTKKRTKEIKTFGTRSINCNEVSCTNNNPFNRLDRPKSVNIVNDKEITYQEANKESAISNHSILSIFKSISESVLCDNVARTKNNTILNNYELENINMKSQNRDLDDSDNVRNKIKTKNLSSKQNVDETKTEENKEFSGLEHIDTTKDRKKAIKTKCMFNKMYRRLIKRSHTNMKKKALGKQTKANCVNNKNENDGTVRITENVRVVVDDQKEHNLELTIKNKKTVDDFFTSEMNMLNKIKTEVQTIDKDVLTKPGPILQKNFYINCSEIRQNKGVCTMPDLALDIKQAVTLITQDDCENYHNKVLKTQNIRYYDDAVTQTEAQTIQVDKEMNCSILASTESLQNNMKHLLDLVLSRVVPICKVNALTGMFDPVEEVSRDVDRINSIESSCESLKVNIIEIRRISNHTLLVRWKLPLKTVYIQGYELQVDGRSVQKIFSPKRCMAVLTCLPRCEKLLLTIRTLTTRLLSDHYPATTVVYRPFIK